MKISDVVTYLADKKMYEFEDIKFKVIPLDDGVKLGFDVKLEPKISIKDPQIKDLKLEVGDIIATFRDYELRVDPYYAYRVVE